MKRPVDYLYATTFLGPGQTSEISIGADGSEYFLPTNIKIDCFDPKDPSKNLDVDVGRIAIGGVPQGGISGRTGPYPSNRYIETVRAADLPAIKFDLVGSSSGSRELSISLQNPNKCELLVFICLTGLKFESDGFDHVKMECEEEDCPTIQEQEKHAQKYRNAFADKREELRDNLAAEWASRESELSSNANSNVTLLPTETTTLLPYERKAFSIDYSYAPYIRPKRIKFSASGSGVVARSGDVPLVLVDAFLGGRLLYGSLQAKWFDRLLNPSWSKSAVEQLDELRNDMGKSSVVPTPEGMLSTHLYGPDGWHDVRWWPNTSSAHIGQNINVILYNPWSFAIDARVSLEGCPLSAEDHREMTSPVE